MNVLKLIFIPYMGLGVFTAVAIQAARSGRLAWHPAFADFAILAAVHLLLFGGGFFLAARSNQQHPKLSPSGLSVGLVLAYAAGLVFPFCV
jgi:acyl-CoA synthetase (AMP-forming)/AMP-acid ligase II